MNDQKENLLRLEKIYKDNFAVLIDLKDQLCKLQDKVLEANDRVLESFKKFSTAKEDYLVDILTEQDKQIKKLSVVNTNVATNGTNNAANGTNSKSLNNTLSNNNSSKTSTLNTVFKTSLYTVNEERSDNLEEL